MSLTPSHLALSSSTISVFLVDQFLRFCHLELDKEAIFELMVSWHIPVFFLGGEWGWILSDFRVLSFCGLCVGLVFLHIGYNALRLYFCYRQCVIQSLVSLTESTILFYIKSILWKSLILIRFLLFSLGFIKSCLSKLYIKNIWY